jgi:hypothetical protein
MVEIGLCGKNGLEEGGGEAVPSREVGVESDLIGERA